MALRIRCWLKWQGAQINAVKRNRKKKSHAEGAPYSMQTLSVCTQIERDGDFRVFAREVGPPKALTYFIRVLIAAGVADGMKGIVDVSRSEFGRWVLSTPDHRVGTKEGQKVYDALRMSRLCVEVGPGSGPVSSPGSRPGADPGREGGHCNDMWSRDKGPDTGPPTSSGARSPTSTSPGGSVGSRAQGGYESLRETAERMGICPPKRSVVTCESGHKWEVCAGEAIECRECKTQAARVFSRENSDGPTKPMTADDLTQAARSEDRAAHPAP